MTTKRQRIRNGLILVSFFLFPVFFYYLSPALVIMASGEGTINGSLVIFFLLFISALVVGRGFCGWLCPAAGCQEALFLAQDKRVKRGNILKWLIWVPWLSAIIYLTIKTGGYKKIDFFYQTHYGLSIYDLQSFITYNLILFILIVIPGLVFGKRSFCHHLCWMAPFMIIGRSIRNVFGYPSLQLRAASEQCIHCHTCTDHCPMSLEVEEMVEREKMENQECILCGRCVDGCPNDAITYRMC